MGVLLLFVILPVNFAFTPRLSRQRARAPARAPRLGRHPGARRGALNRAPPCARTCRRLTRFSRFSSSTTGRRIGPGRFSPASRGRTRAWRVIAGKEPPPMAGSASRTPFISARSAASGELLLFVDADVVYDPRTLGEAVALLQSQRLDFLALLPRFATEGLLGERAHAVRPRGLFRRVRLPGQRRLAALGGGGRRSGQSDSRGLSTILWEGTPRSRTRWSTTCTSPSGPSAPVFARAAVRAEDRVSVRMYRGLAEVVNGFTKNIAYALQGLIGAFLFAADRGDHPLLGRAAADAAGCARSARRSRRPTSLLAAAGFALVVAARIAAAAASRDPLWPAVTHPIMAAVWAGIICRSLFIGSSGGA